MLVVEGDAGQQLDRHRGRRSPGRRASTARPGPRDAPPPSASGLQVEVAHPPFEGGGSGPCGSYQRARGAHCRYPFEIIFHRRVRVLEHAAKTSVAEAHRVFGVSRKTIHHWKRLSESYGLDALMPKGRRGAPAMPNATPTWVVEGLLAEAVVRPTLGAARYAECLEARGFVISPSGVQKLLHRSGLGRRRQRVAAPAQLTAVTTGPGDEPAREGPFGFCHFAARPGDLVALDRARP